MQLLNEPCPGSTTLSLNLIEAELQSLRDLHAKTIELKDNQIDQLQMAQMVFELYCKRAKIEGVFKFCKEVLGWEDNRIPDYNVVKNLISLIYFIAGYFYEIEDQLIHDKNIEWIAQLGGGKGKITRHFILNGLAQLINYKLAQRFFEQQNISSEQVNDALNRFSFGNQ